MTNAKNENFSLEAELDETAGWDLDDPESEIALDDRAERVWKQPRLDEAAPEHEPPKIPLTTTTKAMSSRCARSMGACIGN